MGLTSHLSDAYNTPYSYRVSFSLILILTKMSLITSLTMMVLDPGLPLNLVHLLRAHFLKFPLIVFMDCHVMESNNLVVVSVEYSQYEYFALKNFPNVKFRILNMINVCCRFTRSFKTMSRREAVVFEVFPPCTVQRVCSR